MKTYATRFCLALGLLLPATVSFADVDLSVSKTGPSTVVAGTDIVYEIFVSNNGPDPATNVEVSDVYTLPPVGEGAAGAATCGDAVDNDADLATDQADTECEGLVYVGATQPCAITGSTVTEGTLTCTLGTLLPGESVSFTVKFHVTPAYLIKNGLFVTNTATASATEGDSFLGNNTDQVETVVEEVADLRISKIAEPSGTVNAGTIIFYTIWVDNFGPSAARNVTIRDALVNSDDVIIQSCAFSVSQGGGAITQFTCTTGPLVQTQFGSDIGTFKTNFLYPMTPTSQGRLRASFRIVANTDMDLTNSSRVTSDTFDPDIDNNDATVGLEVVPVANLAVDSLFGAEVQVDGQPGLAIDTNLPAPPMPEAPNYNFGGTNVTAGRRIDFSSSVENNGPSPANNVLLEFLLPAGASVLVGTVDANPGDLTADGTCYTEPAGEPRRSVFCQYDTLEIGDVATASFQILVGSDVPDNTLLSIESFARSDEFDPALSDNVTSVQFAVNNWADLGIVKSAIGPVVAGSPLGYEIQISNAGASNAHDVTLRDVLPSGVTFVDAYVDLEGTSAFAPLPCGLVVASNTLYCPMGEIAPTGSTPILVIVNVAVDSEVAEGTPITNTADVLLKDTPDPVLGDNTDNAQSEVTTSADLELVKTANADVYSPSVRITFILTVTNHGPSVAEDVVVVDDLPPANTATYVFDSGGCLLAGTTLTCEVGTLAVGESRNINVYMIPKGKKGRITNFATVSGSTSDEDSDNNTSFKTVLVKGGKGSHTGK